MRVSLLAVLVLAGIASAQDHVVAPGKLPYAFEFEAPSAGYVRLDFAEKVQGFTPFLEFAAPTGWPIAQDQCDARVEAGRVKFVLKDRWGNTPAGEFRFKVEFVSEADASEPNGDWEHARPARFGEKLALAVRPAGDHDMMRLEVEEPGYIRATFEGEAQGVRAVFYLDPTRELTPNEARIDVPGSVFVDVHDRWGNAHEAPFSVTFTFEPENDPWEPNDSPGMAAAIELGEWSPVRIAPAGDQDWFEVEAPEAGYLVCEIAELEGFTPVWSAWVPGGTEPVSTGPTLRVPAGRVQVMFSDRWGNSIGRALPFRIRFAPDPDDSGANDDATAPSRIDVNREYRLALADAGDREFLEFELAETSAVTMELSGDQPGNMTIELVAADNTVIPFGDGSRYLGKGLHRIVIATKYGAFSIAPFKLTVAAAPVDDPAEPNDSPATATRLAIGTPVEVRLGPGDADVDWYEVEAPSDGIFYVLTSEDTGWSSSCALVDLVSVDGTGTWPLTQNPRAPLRFIDVTKGLWRLRIRPDGRPVPRIQRLNLLVAFIARAEGVAAGSALLDVAVIGLDVDDSTMAGLRAMAASGGASFTNTKDLEQLEKQMRTIVERTKKDAEDRARPTPPPAEASGSSALPWIGGGAALLVVVLAAVGWRLLKRA